jgi:hypothetical protein
VNTIWKIPEGIEAPEMVTLLMDFATDSIKEYQIRMALLKRQPVGLDPEDQSQPSVARDHDCGANFRGHGRYAVKIQNADPR